MTPTQLFSADTCVEPLALTELPLTARGPTGQRKVPLANLTGSALNSAVITSAAGVPYSSARGVPPPPRALPCEVYQQPTLLGQEVTHAQFTNFFTRQHIFRSLHWWRQASLHGGSTLANATHEAEHGKISSLADIGSRAANALSSAEACVAPEESLGVMIGSAESNRAWLCAPPEANPHVGCPCCWESTELASAAYDHRVRALIGCRVWNANW